MEVVLYTLNGDPYSDMVRNLLISNNITFTTIEVSRNEEKQRELEALSGQPKAPVLVIDGKVYAGFDRALIKQVLGLKE